jgi:S1-C subfamily serine protease
LVRAGDGIGSAVLISSDGFALTAAHVVGEFDAVTVVVGSGDELQASVVRVDERQDVALLKVDAFGPTACLPPVHGRASIGSDIFVLGSPAGEELSFSVAKGIVSAYREFSGAGFVQLDASINPGNSGGPVVDETGAIVGLASWKVSHVSMEGLAFAVPVDAALSALDVELAPKSDADWRALTGRRTYRPPAPKRSATAPLTSLDVAPATQRRSALRKGLLGGGSAALALGVVAVVATGSVFLAERSYMRDGVGDGISEKTWGTLVGINTAGWALGAVGAGLLVAGIVIRPRKNTEREVALMPLRGGLAASGRF